MRVAESALRARRSGHPGLNPCALRMSSSGTSGRSRSHRAPDASRAALISVALGVSASDESSHRTFPMGHHCPTRRMHRCRRPHSPTPTSSIICAPEPLTCASSARSKIPSLMASDDCAGQLRGTRDGAAGVLGRGARFDPSPVMSRRMAERLGGAPATVVPGVATFGMLRVYPDVLRHAAALGAKRRARRYWLTTGRPVPFIISGSAAGLASRGS